MRWNIKITKNGIFQENTATANFKKIIWNIKYPRNIPKICRNNLDNIFIPVAVSSYGEALWGPNLSLFLFYIFPWKKFFRFKFKSGFLIFLTIFFLLWRTDGGWWWLWWWWMDGGKKGSLILLKIFQIKLKIHKFAVFWKICEKLLLLEKILTSSFKIGVFFFEKNIS